jgi:hypothetical protein
LLFNGIGFLDAYAAFELIIELDGLRALCEVVRRSGKRAAGSSLGGTMQDAHGAKVRTHFYAKSPEYSYTPSACA